MKTVFDAADAAELSDAQLITQARAGDNDAFGLLYRRHSGSAKGLAVKLAGPKTADDIVSEAFTRVFAILQKGGGPDFAFRPYLLAAVHNAYVSYVRTDSKLVWVEDYSSHEESLEKPDETSLRDESSVLARAFRSLPERWQVVLWHSSVEQESTAEVGDLLGMSPNAVAALSFRAREGLRQAYLAEHLAGADDQTCKEIRRLLPGYIRQRLGSSQNAQVVNHLDDCPACAAAVADARALGTSALGAMLAPAILGYVAAAALPTAFGGAATGSHATHASATAGTASGVGVPGIIAGALATTVVAVGALAAFGALPGVGSDVRAAQKQSVTSPARIKDTPAPIVIRRAEKALPATDSAAPEPKPVAMSPATTAPADDKPTPQRKVASVPPGKTRPSVPVTPPPTTPPTPPPATEEHDLSLALASLTKFPETANGWTHAVGMQVRGGAEGTQVVIVINGLQSWFAHDADGMPVNCSSTSGDGSDGNPVESSTIVCDISSSEEEFLELDFRAPDDAPFAAAVFAPDNTDPDPANNNLVVDIN